MDHADGTFGHRRRFQENNVRRIRIKSLVPNALTLFALVCVVCSGCAYFRPSQEQAEAERLREQESMRQQEEFRRTLAGGLMGAAVSAVGSGLSHY